MCVMWLEMLFCVIFTHQSLAYNFYKDLNNVIRSDKNSFGYSVVLQKNRIFISAPKSQNQTFHGAYGEVYSCLEFKACEDFARKSMNTDGVLVGGAMDGFVEADSSVVITAPRRFDEAYYQPEGMHFYATAGYMTKKYNHFQYDPNVITVNESSHHFTAYAESGFSMKIIDKDTIIFGAPGFFTHSGALVKFDSNSETFKFRYETETNSMMGYSIDYGKAQGKLFYLVGAPKAKNYYGQAYIIWENAFHSEGSQFIARTYDGTDQFSYFGESVLTVDINSDNSDDIIVGAPSYAGRTYDEGCIFVFINDIHGTFKENAVLKHCRTSPGGRFGTTMMNFGKLYDNDESIYVAVSAPYENGGRGAVYIFNAIYTAYGYDLLEVQKLAAGEDQRSFGYSLSKAVDVDGNQLPDFAVGAYNSREVFLIKGAPIVRLRFTSLIASITKIVKTGTFDLLFCLLFESGQKMDFIRNVEVHIEVDMRRVSLPVNNILVDVFKKERCHQVQAKVNNLVVTEMKPVVFKFIAAVTSQDFCENCPVEYRRFDPEYRAIATHTLEVSYQCKDDLECTPQYQVNAQQTRILIEKDSAMAPIRFSVLNVGDPAYLCKVNITLPPTVYINNIPKECDNIEDSGHRALLKCDLGNPLISNKTANISLVVNIENLDLTLQKLCYNIAIYNYNNIGNLEKIICIDLHFQRKLSLIGNSNPRTIVKADTTTVVDISHEFTVINEGRSPYQDLVVHAYIPRFDANKNVNLMEYYNPLVILDNVQSHLFEHCSMSPVPDFLDMLTNSTEPIHPPVPSRLVDSSEEEMMNLKRRNNMLQQSDHVEMSNIHYTNVKCYLNKLKYSFVMKLPLRLNVSQMEFAYAEELSSKQIILLTSFANVSHNNDSIEGESSTLLQFAFGGISTLLLIVIICSAILVAISLFCMIIVVLRKVNFFKRPLLEKMDGHENERVLLDEVNLTTN